MTLDEIESWLNDVGTGDEWSEKLIPKLLAVARAAEDVLWLEPGRFTYEMDHECLEAALKELEREE